MFDLDTLRRAFRILLRPRTFSLRRFAVVMGFLIAVWVFSVVVMVGQTLDHIFFPGFRKTEVREPIFVIANPRSGTTFMHRLMCLDDERFTYMKLYQTLFPAVTWYKAIAALAWVDRHIGRPMERLLRVCERAWFKGWDGVHAVGWTRAEEEEFIFIMTLLDPAVLMILPSPTEMTHLDFLDRLPDEKRQRVMRFYRGCLQRHIFATGRDRILLSKNVFFGGRLRSVCEAFPDARFVQLVRHPYNALGSMISMFSGPYSIHSPKLPKDSPEFRYWARLGMDYYLYVLERGEEFAGAERFVTYRYDDFVGDPKGTVEDIYRHFDIPMTDAFRARLDREATRASKYRSVHEYDLSEYGLDRAEIYERLRPYFEKYGFARDPGGGDTPSGPGLVEDPPQDPVPSPVRAGPQKSDVAVEPA